MKREPQAGDVTISRNSSMKGLTFTLFLFPREDALDGVAYQSERSARDAATTIARERGVDVWLESPVEPGRFDCVTTE